MSDKFTKMLEAAEKRAKRIREKADEQVRLAHIEQADAMVALFQELLAERDLNDTTLTLRKIDDSTAHVYMDGSLWVKIDWVVTRNPAARDTIDWIDAQLYAPWVLYIPDNTILNPPKEK